MTHFYKRIARDSWIRSSDPSYSGVWISEQEYKLQRHIERRLRERNERYMRRNVRRQLR